jgi:shikimate kinase
MDDTAPKKNLIYLAGFMGSGKSTIGPILANTLGYDFLDIDKIIEGKTTKRIVDIFAESGEEAFRSIERNTLKEISVRDRCVVSLGGGTIANVENFRLIRESGMIIYLQLSPEEILKRVHFKTDRPMLKDGQGEKLPEEKMRGRIQELLQRREEFYLQADIVVKTDQVKVGTTVDEIVHKLRGLIEF